MNQAQTTIPAPISQMQLCGKQEVMNLSEATLIAGITSTRGLAVTMWERPARRTHPKEQH